MDFVGFTLRNNLFVAPMAGVTDRPFRQLCKKMGAGLAVSERGLIVVDDHQRTADPAIYAVGDAVTKTDLVDGEETVNWLANPSINSEMVFGPWPWANCSARSLTARIGRKRMEISCCALAKMRIDTMSSGRAMS